MPKLAANISWLFAEVPFLDRFAAAAAAGFQAVEFQFPDDTPPEEIARRLQQHRLTPALFNMPAGDYAKGDRGMAALPGREAEFMAAAERALTLARATGCTRIHALAGIWPEGRPKAEGEETYVANLRRAAELMAPHGISVLIEPLNSRDTPGYFLNASGDALRVIARVGRANLSLQFDLYHCQIMEGDLARHVRALAGRFAHVQIAGVPDRNEPDIGEVNFPYLLDLLDETGYDGWVGCEYRPRAGTLAGLGWARRWGIGKPR
ncbi:MAG TPA: 2-oxo-tetronate isomerase [Stellaceae bacterium]|nr:2-oxo-tetronate isomerase [Stellaceae bacterium]